MMPVLRSSLVLLLSAVSLWPVPAHAQLDGALFTLPEERVYLDYLRQEFLLRSQEAGFDIEVVDIPEVPEGTVVEETSGPAEFSFGGILTRRDGSHSIWLNGRLLNESELPDGVALVAGANSLSLRVAYEGAVYVLRPGQTVDVTTGAISEAWQRIPVAEPESSINPPGAAVAPAVADPDAARETAAPSAAEATEANAVTAAPSAEAPAEASVNAIADTLSQLSPEQMTALSSELERRQQAEDDEP